MKTIEIPKDLLGLPFPWNVPENSCRRKYIKVLDADKKTLERALVALERVLSYLSQHQEPKGESIPDVMSEYWNFTVSSIASEIPTLEDFNLAKIEKKFRLSKIESPSEIMLEEAARKWIWTVAYSTASSIIPWLEKTMRKYQDSELVSRYLSIASRYWHSSIPRALISSLVATSKWIAREKAIPLLEEVQQNAQNKELADMARDFKRLMVDPNYG